MGIPSFFRWLTEKYPKVVIKAKETFNGDLSQDEDLRLPHPNMAAIGGEFDNLYLDMNGIIHPCCHPEGEEPPANEFEMFKNISKYIDRIFSLIRPRKLIFMAIDGVAPRAKMNQQRSRRFRAAQEADDARRDEEKLRAEAISMGIKPPPKKKPVWDSNVITPGTEFLCELSKYLRYYVADRQNHDLAWKSVKVIISDSQSPGEGEHKIMQFVRRQRAEHDHDPNTRHVLYGLDADLIMLALASHEVHFTVLREEVLFGKDKQNVGKVKDPVLFGPSVDAEAIVDQITDTSIEGSPKKPFVFLKVWVLREYLTVEFNPSNFMGEISFGYDFERVIDDIIMLCFLIGNDFLPHLPVLSIREGALELLFDLYKRYLPIVGGYLTNDGDIDVSKLEVMMGVLGTVEDDIFRKRKELEDREKERKKRLGKGEKEVQAKLKKGKHTILDDSETLTLVPLGAKNIANQIPEPPKSKAENKNAAASLKALLSGSNGLSASSSENEGKKSPEPKIVEEEAEFEGGDVNAKKRKRDDDNNNDNEMSKSEDKNDGSDAPESVATKNDIDTSFYSDAEKFDAKLKEMERSRNVFNNIPDLVRLGEEGWKDRYYVTKFGEDQGRDPAFRRRMVENYVQGLCWVMQYYYKGCQSWKWFYEYHYAPFASDFINVDNLDITWAPSKPFKPFEQLMGVFPPQSSHALPKPCAWYMTNSDSPIINFYPKEFLYDEDGKGMRWLWIALLPFIDEKKLLDVCKKLESEYAEEETKRNSFLPDILLVHQSCKGADEILKMIQSFESKENKGLQEAIKINSESEDEMIEIDSTPKTAGDLLTLENEKSDSLVNEGAKAKAHKKNLGVYLSAKIAYGISGYFLPVADPLLRIEIGKEISTTYGSLARITPGDRNKVFSCEFRLPPMKPHLSRLVPGVIMPKPELTHEDIQPRRVRTNGIDVSRLLETKEERKAGWQRSWGSAEPRYIKASSIQQPNQQNSFFGINQQQFNGGYMAPHPGMIINHGAPPPYPSPAFGNQQMPYPPPPNFNYPMQQYPPPPSSFGGNPMNYPPPPPGYFSYPPPPPPIQNQGYFAGNNDTSSLLDQISQSLNQRRGDQPPSASNANSSSQYPRHPPSR